MTIGRIERDSIERDLMATEDAAKPDTTAASGDEENPGKLKRELNAFDLTVSIPPRTRD